MKSILVLTCLIHYLKAEYENENDISYSFHKFRGPVSGHVQQITMPDAHSNEPRVDYVAKPDYIYAYGVEDPKTDNSQTHKEARDGNDVIGEYRVLQPDGLIRIVRYTANGKEGFKATVEYERSADC